MIPLVEPPAQIWVCEHCTVRVRTAPTTKTPLHPCTGLRGFRVPLILEGTQDHLRLVEREDYIGGDDVQLDGEGRPVMRAEVERADGSQRGVWVYAPTAHANVKGQ